MRQRAGSASYTDFLVAGDKGDLPSVDDMVSTSSLFVNHLSPAATFITPKGGVRVPLMLRLASGVDPRSR